MTVLVITECRHGRSWFSCGRCSHVKPPKGMKWCRCGAAIAKDWAQCGECVQRETEDHVLGGPYRRAVTHAAFKEAGWK